MERNFDIEAKLLSLLELSKSEANDNESKLALEMAIRLAAKHGISLSSLTAKRAAYAGNWHASEVNVRPTEEYTDERFRYRSPQEWCDLVEEYGWQRHRKTYDQYEGQIWMYRHPGVTNPKLETRIFERSWGDIEFEVVKNPDPIIGSLDLYTQMGFDCVELGTTFSDFRSWLERSGCQKTSA